MAAARRDIAASLLGTSDPRVQQRAREFRERYGSINLRWADGWGVSAVSGITVPEWARLHPEQITLESIHEKQNLEVRRAMIELYGVSRYVRDSSFRVIHRDTDPLGLPRRLLREVPKRPDGIKGLHWKKPPRFDLLLVVEVRNSTPDHDGTHRVYHIPVHPFLRPLLPGDLLGPRQELTCLNAIASTYGMTGEEYAKLARET